MLCRWCRSELSALKRSDAFFCSQSCRQASWRFTSCQPGMTTVGRKMRFAYADPPYPGYESLYQGRPEAVGPVDHVALVSQLMEEFSDGWILSTSADNLRDVLGLCPAGVRVGAWVRGHRGSRSYSPVSAWEPVIWFGGRKQVAVDQVVRSDTLVHLLRARRADPLRVPGSKPAAFCYWLFSLLNAGLGDEFVDLFPGSGRVGDAWVVFQRGTTAWKKEEVLDGS